MREGQQSLLTLSQEGKTSRCYANPTHICIRRGKNNELIWD